MSEINESRLSKQEKAFIDELKNHLYKLASFKCLEKLTEFNDCRDTGIKKNKKIKQIQDDEVKYYEVTKGCFDEYQEYLGCIKGLVNEMSQSKEISQMFTGKRRLSFNKEQFKELLIKHYKLI